MGSLTLVRHGQASFLSDDYDRLSELGARQARALGEYWSSRGVCFDRVLRGPARRHFATEVEVASAYRARGLAWPESEVLEAFDEFQWLAIFQAYVPVLCERDPSLRPLVDALESCREQEEAMEHFDRLFRLVVPHWLEGTIEADQVESWPAFRERVLAAAQALCADGGRIAVVSSAGVMSALVAESLDLAPANMMKLTMVIRNAAWSEFLFSPDRFLLYTFNATPHLDRPELLTYR